MSERDYIPSNDLAEQKDVIEGVPANEKGDSSVINSENKNKKENTEKKQKNRRENYDMSYRRTTNNKKVYGELHSETPYIYPMKPVGTKVIVRLKVQHERETKSGKPYHWETPLRYKDELLNEPMQYTIVAYTEGALENPSDNKHMVFLEFVTRRGAVIKESFKTKEVALGTIKLLEV